ncbi:MAG TPA: hypothetical protein VE046_07270 [Steroidobacteraceae bacterium]|nr:hypothetical protein [Steroidobacteraceae bacterium]
MRNFNTSGFRASVGVAAAVTVTALTVLLFQSPYTAWGTRAQPPEEIALSVQVLPIDARNV